MNRWAGLMPMDTSRYTANGAGKRLVQPLTMRERPPYVEQKSKAPTRLERLRAKQAAVRSAKAAERLQRKEERRMAQKRQLELSRLADAAVGALLKKKREAMGLSQGHMARQIGCNRKFLNGWESGKESVPKARRERVCACYAIPLDSWVTMCLQLSVDAVSKKAVSA